MTQTFGALLRHLRRKNGLTQEQLAERLGYSRSMVAALETDRRLPQVEELHSNFANALDLHNSRELFEHLTGLALRARPTGTSLPSPSDSSFPSLNSVHAGREVSRVPLPASRLFGREREKQLICDQLLYHDVRLLTLVGSPGVGKTTLALASATVLQEYLREGACFVSLASVTNEEVVGAAILEALGVRLHAASGKAGLIAYLRRKEMVIVLDNFEQILGAAHLVADLFADCPGVRILVTSRERLHLRAEHLLRVQPLELDDAVQLFNARARANNSSLQPGESDLALTQSICQRLDCLPLAIELCAAQADFSTPTQIWERLQSRPLDALVDGAVDLPPRQRTLRATIYASYQLLSVEEKRLFRSLAIFVGGATSELIEKVWTDDYVASAQTGKTLRSLAMKSLIQIEPTAWGDQRVRMLESVREFARERMEDEDDQFILFSRYFDALSRHMSHLDRGLTSEKGDVGLKRIIQEQDNLQTALQWAFDQGQWSAVALLVCMLDEAFESSWRQEEFLTWYERLLPYVNTLDADLALVFKVRFCYAATPAIRDQQQKILNEYRTLVGQCSSPLIKSYALFFGVDLGVDYPDPIAALREAIRLARFDGASDPSAARLGRGFSRDPILLTAVFMCGCELFNRGETVESEMYLREALQIGEEGRIFNAACWTLGYLARVALRRGDFADAVVLAESAVDHASANDNAKGLAGWRAFLGQAIMHAGNPVEARRTLEQAWADGCVQGDPFMKQIPAIFLAELALNEDNPDDARNWLVECMALSASSSRELDWRPIHRSMLAARLAALEGRDVRAAQLYGFMRAYDDRIKIGPTGPVIDTAAEAMAQVRKRMGEEAYEAAYEVGNRLPVTETLANLLS